MTKTDQLKSKARSLADFDYFQNNIDLTYTVLYEEAFRHVLTQEPNDFFKGLNHFNSEWYRNGCKAATWTTTFHASAWENERVSRGIENHSSNIDRLSLFNKWLKEQS
jgi:hypothetical protein